MKYGYVLSACDEFQLITKSSFCIKGGRRLTKPIISDFDFNTFRHTKNREEETDGEAIGREPKRKRTKGTAVSIPQNMDNCL